MDELVDIVNKNDEVISQKMKSEAHSNILIHRTVHWILTNDNKEIFLVTRALTREKWPWLYDASIGWHVLANETYENAILREWQEELWIKKWNYKFICKYFSDHPRMKHICWVFIINYNWKIELDPREFDKWERMKYEDILKLPQEKFTPDYLITLNSIKIHFS